MGYLENQHLLLILGFYMFVSKVQKILFPNKEFVFKNKNSDYVLIRFIV